MSRAPRSLSVHADWCEVVRKAYDDAFTRSSYATRKILAQNIPLDADGKLVGVSIDTVAKFVKGKPIDKFYFNVLCQYFGFKAEVITLKQNMKEEGLELNSGKQNSSEYTQRIEQESDINTGFMVGQADRVRIFERSDSLSVRVNLKTDKANVEKPQERKTITQKSNQNKAFMIASCDQLEIPEPKLKS